VGKKWIVNSTSPYPTQDGANETGKNGQIFQIKEQSKKSEKTKIKNGRHDLGPVGRGLF